MKSLERKYVFPVESQIVAALIIDPKKQKAMKAAIHAAFSKKLLW